MKVLTLLASTFVLALCACGQTTTTATSPTVVNTSALPSMTIGAGGAWNRGAAYPLNVDTDLAIHLGTVSNWYSWTTISTPVAPTPKGSSPVASSVITGAAYVAAQSPTGSISLVLIVQAGFSATATNVAPSFSGNVAVPIRLGKTHAYLMPYVKAGNPTFGTNGAAATAILQPGFMILYGFGGK